MSGVVKIAAAAVTAALCAVVVRRQSPEIALVLGAGACALLVLYCSGALRAVMELADKLAQAEELKAQAQAKLEAADDEIHDERMRAQQAASDAAQEQLEAIRRLYELDRVGGLPAQLKETIILRETYPELTLRELAEEFEPPVTKSCLQHRLRKLVELSRQ